MELDIMQIFFAIGLFVILIYMLSKFMLKPMGLFFKIAYGFMFGLLMIWGFNFIGGFVGFSLPANIFTVATTGFLGVPGLGLLLLLQIFV